MRHLFVVFAIAVLITYCQAERRFNYVVHEKRNHLLSPWQKRSATSLTVRQQAAPITMRIALKHENVHLGEKYVMDVSHPDSSTYGQHWTIDQVASSFAPSGETVAKVKSWLTAEGVAETNIAVSRDKTWIRVKTSLAQAASLLKTKYHVLEDSESETMSIACDQYHVPDFVHSLIDFITPTVHTAQRSPQLLKRSSAGADPETDPRLRLSHQPILHDPMPDDLSTCGDAVTLDCLRKLYNIPKETTANKKNSLGVVELNPDGWYSQIDLDMFFANYSKSLVGRPPQRISIDGAIPAYKRPFTFYDNLGESDLDLQIAMPLTYPLNVTFYSVGDGYIGASFNTWLDALDASYCSFEGGDDPSIDPVYPDNSTAEPGYGNPYNKTEQCGGARPSHVYSVSYAALEFGFTPAYATRMCEEFMKLTLQGSTFLFASDDYGVGAPQAIGCTGPNGTSFTPAFPATCPWITAVGGSAIDFNKTVFDPETAYGASGGGFSNLFPMPAYQSQAVLDWFAHNPTDYPPGTFNDSRRARGIPDLAANAWEIVSVTNGEYTLTGGTSSATPIVASIITLINNSRLNAGKGPVGFINPVIYANPQAFNDITTGYNPGCGTNGFNATKGWDPVTGLGTPNYEKLLKVFMDLP